VKTKEHEISKEDNECLKLYGLDARKIKLKRMLRGVTRNPS